MWFPLIQRESFQSNITKLHRRVYGLSTLVGIDFDGDPKNKMAAIADFSKSGVRLFKGKVFNQTLRNFADVFMGLVPWMGLILTVIKKRKWPPWPISQKLVSAHLKENFSIRHYETSQICLWA